MKITIVHNHYKQLGGEDIVFQQERQLLERKGHDVQVYTRTNYEVDSYPGVKRLVLLQNAIWSGDTYRDFGAMLRRNRPDVVHVHNTWVMVSPSIYEVCKEEGVPVVQTFHNYRLMCPAGTFFRAGKTCEECLHHGQWRSILHGCYRNSRVMTAAKALMLATHRRRGTWDGIDYFIALTEFSKGQFLKGGFPPEKLFVKPNFVHPDPGLGTEKDDYALFIGRLSPEKRVSTILSAWTKLKTRIPLHIIGGGPEAPTLKEEAHKKGLDCVEFHGHVPRERVIEYMRRARFLIFSSEWYENFPVTIAEAFACGVPVIGSRMGAMQEIVDDRRTGLHFIPGDAADLAAKVEWAWENPAQMMAMGKEARREYEEKYTAEKNYPILLGIYEHAIAQNKAKSRRVELVESVPESSEAEVTVPVNS